MSNIATLDNGTMVEVFKHLNYCQLAKSSLVSKRFCGMIHTHRHKLVLLYVAHIGMSSFDSQSSTYTNVFDKHFSPEEYNEWVMHNGYSKQIPLIDQVAAEECAQNGVKIYELKAGAFYNDSNQRVWLDKTPVFYARTELKNESWHVFQHFAGLLSDPFIYIRSVRLVPNVFNLMIGAVNLDSNRLQCEQLTFILESNGKKFIDWVKEHMSCKKIQIHDLSSSTISSNSEEFLDLFVTGAHCTSEINITYHNDLSQIVVDLVQKFMDMNNRYQYQFVESLESYASDEILEALKSNYAKFITSKEDKDENNVYYVFEFVNNDIGKKLKLSVTIPSRFLLLKIDNL